MKPLRVRSGPQRCRGKIEGTEESVERLELERSVSLGSILASQFPKRSGPRTSVTVAWAREKYLMLRCFVLILAVLVMISSALQGQGTDKGQWTVKPLRIQEPPQLDGVLDERFWDSVGPIVDFRQQEPKDNEPATEKTEVRICYDQDNLYFGIRAYESEPDRLVRSSYERDGFMPADDSILIGIDSNKDNRTAFIFEMNTLGAKTDIELSEEGTLFNINWDAIWRYKAKVYEDQYVIEAAIPFFVLRFSPDETVDMGLLLKRRIRKNNEEANWPYLSRDYGMDAVSQYGSMTGLKAIERGKRLEFKPYGTAGYSEAVPDERVSEFDAGLDVKWGITSNLTADFTLNTDFAQVEADALQVNLTRFNLFFPEKRDFFLESAELFQFGLPRRVEVFFSRRIGLRDFGETPILGGARTYGLLGDTNLGLMTIQTRDSQGIPGENFTVARVKQNIFGRSYFGGIITRRAGYEVDEDTSVGGDFMILTKSNVRFHGSLARSGRAGVTSGNWFGTVGALQFLDRFSWELRYDDVGSDFDPGIGFVVRPDQRTLTTFGEYAPRPGWKGVRQFHFSGLFRRTENHSGVLETRIVTPAASVEFQSDDQLAFIFSDIFDYVPEDFEIAPDVVIPKGAYDNRDFSITAGTSPSRKVAGMGSFRTGKFYDGDIVGGAVELRLRPISWLHLNLESQVDRINVPGGDFTSAINRVFVSYFANANVSTRVGVQHSALYGDFVLNLRFRWIYAPGSEIWFVYNEGRDFGQPRQTLQDRALIFKIVHNFNF